MYEIKKQIYLDLTKNQKSALCNYLRLMVKKFPNQTWNDLWEKFYSDEKYYLELKCSRFEFLEEKLDDLEFQTDTEKYLKECIKYYEYRQKQQPIIEAKKEFEKKKRKFLQEVKMSKQPPTKKQLYYYKKLCEKYSIQPQKPESKLDARDKIDRILTQHQIIIETPKDEKC